MDFNFDSTDEILEGAILRDFAVLSRTSAEIKTMELCLNATSFSNAKTKESSEFLNPLEFE